MTEVDCLSCERTNSERSPHQLGLGCHYWQRPRWHLVTVCPQTRLIAHPRIVVVHRRCASHHVCAGHLGRHHGEPRQGSVPSVSRVLGFRGHHCHRHYLFVPCPTQRPRVLVVRLRRALHHGPRHSGHARRPSRLVR